ncbi:MAG TPA: RagB/SusD family nutrient uptake outer membrane protein [Pedobacter sp.]|uniref:RagB/SusD family nutrient uptake outer membrane protein n=1 Tax=Pedobacter sp. TaxID=1411316 RepID=UPI002B75208F|nr:RagB/SusD family nutrient uptake outer membrane protein [Pedobacter sp.]HMI04887.1 RagB/SusD family nutrient uptake outer membrane protein [Pedobacter sp.]
MKRLNQIIYLLAIIVTTSIGCKKDFLNAKPRTTIVAPTNLKDLEMLLENSDVLTSNTPGLTIMGSDEYVFIDYSNWQSAFTATERNSYIWAKDIFNGEINIQDWNDGYKAIFYCNNVLETISTIDRSKSDIALYDTVKGWALFARAYILYDLVSTFSPAYDASTSSSDLGVPIRLKPGIDEILQRSSVKDTYNQILTDLDEAKKLLSASMPINRNRPSKSAAYALFSRIYLSMREYNLAENYADSTLQLYNKLIDYNTISKTSTGPFPINCDEAIYINGAVASPYGIINPFNGNTAITVNPELIRLYEISDLRLNIFFKTNATTGNLYFNRSYYPVVRAFTGLATDEIYLIKAECLARRNQVPSAMTTLNTLLKMRFSPTDYRDLTASDQTDALNKVLLERRKELVWRALRWYDLRRLNNEGADITLTRVLDGITYTLPPNDPRYVFPIPDDEITRSGIQQNIR